MPQALDLVGQKFGKLTVTRRIGSKYNRPLWECLCECGGTYTTISAQLTAGRTKHCGCVIPQWKHGCSSSKNQTVSREYRSWNGARMRCRNPNDPSYGSYGGRGIKFSHLWDDFTVFLRDMGECPKGLTLDRIDVNGNYEPGNCRWTTVKVQQNNLRCNRRIIYKGEDLTATEWAERYGVGRGYFLAGLSSGYTAEELFHRLENKELKHKKLRFRCDNSAAAKLTSSDIANIVAEYHSIPNVGCRKPKGTREKIAAKYGITARYISSIVGGKTNWIGRQITGYKKGDKDDENI